MWFWGHPYRGICCWRHPPLGFRCWLPPLLGLIWCWRYPPRGNVNVTHPRESDVDTYSGETDVNVTYSREGIWCWRWPIPKIQRSRNFPIYSVQPGELCWIEWMNFLLLNILQRTSDISAKNPNWNQNENIPWGKGCILKSYLHSPQKKRSGERSWQPANFVYWPLTQVEPTLSPDWTKKMTK